MFKTKKKVSSKQKKPLSSQKQKKPLSSQKQKKPLSYPKTKKSKTKNMTGGVFNLFSLYNIMNQPTNDNLIFSIYEEPYNKFLEDDQLSNLIYITKTKNDEDNIYSFVYPYIVENNNLLPIKIIKIKKSDNKFKVDQIFNISDKKLEISNNDNNNSKNNILKLEKEDTLEEITSYIIEQLLKKNILNGEIRQIIPNQNMTNEFKELEKKNKDTKYELSQPIKYNFDIEKNTVNDTEESLINNLKTDNQLK